MTATTLLEPSLENDRAGRPPRPAADTYIALRREILAELEARGEGFDDLIEQEMLDLIARYLKVRVPRDGQGYARQMVLDFLTGRTGYVTHDFISWYRAVPEEKATERQATDTAPEVDLVDESHQYVIALSKDSVIAMLHGNHPRKKRPLEPWKDWQLLTPPVVTLTLDYGMKRPEVAALLAHIYGTLRGQAKSRSSYAGLVFDIHQVARFFPPYVLPDGLPLATAVQLARRGRDTRDGIIRALADFCKVIGEEVSPRQIGKRVHTHIREQCGI